MKEKKYIYYNNDKVYALYYPKTGIMYYNLNFKGRSKLIIINYK